jgi:hypothetical protein
MKLLRSIELLELPRGKDTISVRLTAIACAMAFCFPVAAVSMQAAPAVARVLGTVTAIDGNTVTVKTDAGAVQKVTVQDSTRVVETAPGQTNLSGATAIHVQDLAIGDRVSARGAASADGASLAAVSLIAMKQADVQKKQQADREDWQKRGISGVVKQVNSATGAVTVATGAGAAAKTLTVHAAGTTVIRRYAGDSAKLSDAKPSSLDQVKVGDELRARGARSDDGSELTADEIVAGTFLNVAGVIISVDKSAGTIKLTDLATKKPYVIVCNSDSQLRKLPPMMAQMLAARLKGQGASTSGTGAGPVKASPGAAAPNNAGSESVGKPGNAVNGGPNGGGEHTGSRDPQQILGHAPAIQLADLQKGDAVMVVTTEGTASGTAAATTTAITLIAGVEPMLQASASGSQSLLSSSWSLGSNGPAGGEGAQ